MYCTHTLSTREREELRAELQNIEDEIEAAENKREAASEECRRLSCIRLTLRAKLKASDDY